MPRRQLNPRLRRLLMQATLLVVLAAAIALAALATWRVRLSMRLELAPAQAQGRLVVRLPARWNPTAQTIERGDGIEAEEPPGQQPGRRLRIIRQRSDGLVGPLEHLARSGALKPEMLRGLLEGREGFARANLTVAGWPGQMLTLHAWPRPGIVHKTVIACATLGGGQAVVVQLEGTGTADASDRELVKQMAENVSLAMQGAPAEPPSPIELTDEIQVRAPAHYLLIPSDDPNQLQRQLIFDGAWGEAWVAIDLASCVHFADDPDEALAAMLQARDPDWHSGPIKRLGPHTLVTQRLDPPPAPQSAPPPPGHFPARAYLTSRPDGRALLIIMRGGGPGDARLFDSAWQALGQSLRFDASRDCSALLANGAAAVRGLGAALVLKRVATAARSGSQRWMMWDQAENTDQEVWSQVQWTAPAGSTRGPATAAAAPPTAGEPADSQAAVPEVPLLTGSRTSLPSDPYAGATQFQQEWSVAADLSRYQISTFREVRRAGQALGRQALEQRFSLDRGRMTLAAASGPSLPDAPAPPQFVPGALVPLLLCDLADKPCLLKTESFIGVDTLAPPGLLTLFITRLADAPLRRDEKGEPMDCITVSVNGTGLASRWYFTQEDRQLRFIDFWSGLKAQPAAR